MKPKKLLSILLALVLLLSAAAPTALAADMTGSLDWELDDSGTLHIGGSGHLAAIASAEEQPWAQVRESITTVCFEPTAHIFVEDLSYWFSGCTSLEYAILPAYVFYIGTDAFRGCVSLQELDFCHSDAPSVAADAFDCEGGGEVVIVALNEAVCEAAAAANWAGHTPQAVVMPRTSLLLGACGISGCYCSSCSWRTVYDQYDETYHWAYARCTNCSADEYQYGNRERHSFSSRGVCTVCGYEEQDTSCDHSRSYTQWDGCHWYEYCYYCDELLDSGVSHGTYVYGSWAYYSASQHRRLYSCSVCGEGSYQYGSHSTTSQYASYSTTQHSVRKYCATCGSYIGSTTYASHSFSYGSWQNYSATQHRRLKTCSVCGYSEYEYGTHTDSNGDGYCDSCGYAMTRFSVTVPASMALTVDQYGEVYAASNAEIVNNSTAAVAVSKITVSTINGWTLVPYSSNPAAEKVDVKKLGFSIGGAQTTRSGSSEVLTLGSGWTIAKGASLPLPYDAVVTAMSQPVHEQVLTAVFVLNWA